MNNYSVNDITITNPNRIVYEKGSIKKIDVINYYNIVGKRMLSYLNGRLLSVVRCHNGLTTCFYKKHPINYSKDIHIKKLKSNDGKLKDYFYLTTQKGIIKESQNGTIEFHMWGSKVNHIDSPDIMVFDLDPDENLELDKLRQGAKDLRAILKKLGLKAFIKTSGNKGYHVVVPFSSTPSWDKFSSFAEKVASLMEHKWPEKYTTNIRKEKRKGKIFIDWLRNTKGATTISPYSLRIKNDATISFPITWSELDKIGPSDINITNYYELFKKRDPWRDFFKIKQSLK